MRSICSRCPTVRYADHVGTILAAIVLLASALGPTAALAQPVAAAGSSSAIPRPAALQDDINFWIRVYSEISTDEGFVHDERNLGVVYEKLRFTRNLAPKERQKIVDDVRDRYVLSLQRIAKHLAQLPATATATRPESEDTVPAAESGAQSVSAAEPLSADDQRVLALWKGTATSQKMIDASRTIRFQLGQSDRFKEGLVRSTVWEGHIAEVFANQGLPPELASLPHVESSFNPAAYSKVGAAGLWQFMRSTGRRYMRIDEAVDERLDPYRSTEAAAQLLAYNYRVLGTWPLALTAYNHGAGGLRRAKEELGTDDYVTINRLYRGRTFGFASRNFYPSFLAALTIDQNPEKYFGAIERAAEEKFTEVVLPAYVRFASLERVAGVPRDKLLRMNPALRAPAIEGTRFVPRGYKLRLPEQAQPLTTELLAAKLGPAEQFVAQIESRWHRVRRGDTVQRVAQKYGLRAAQLAALNGLTTSSKLRSGRLLKLPERMPNSLARADESSVAQAEMPRTYIVRRGDSLQAIAARVGVPEAELLRYNSLRNPDFLYEGQRINLAPPPTAAVAATASVDEVKSDPTAVAVAETVREEATLAAARERTAAAEPVAALPPTVQTNKPDVAPSSVTRPVRTPRRSNAPRLPEPVTEEQAEAESPAVGPAGAASVLTDAIDLGVAKDGSIRVAAAETLGQFAEWAGIGASRVRALNRMRPGQPVLLGQKLRLEFVKVSREQFEQQRREFHARLQARFFAEHRILGTEIYVVRRGDTLWNVTQRYSNLPIWLLQQYNPDNDLAELRAGTQLVMPRVEALQPATTASR